MSKDVSRFDKTMNRKEGSILDVAANSEMFSRFNDALTFKLWLLGDKVEFEGEMIDMTHFEFMLASLKMPQEVNRYHLKQFYASLWPYIQKIVDNYKSLDVGFETIVKDQDLVMKKHADQHLELSCYKDFIALLPTEHTINFKAYLKQRVSEINQLKRVAIAREEKFIAKQKKTQKKKTFERVIKI